MTADSGAMKQVVNGVKYSHHLQVHDGGKLKLSDGTAAYTVHKRENHITVMVGQLVYETLPRPFTLFESAMRFRI